MQPEHPLSTISITTPFPFNPTVNPRRSGYVPTPLEPRTPEIYSYRVEQILVLRRLNQRPHPYPQPPSSPVRPPIRLIVSTLTHLVPGEDHAARVLFLLNLLAKYHFGTDYEVGKHRYYTRDTLFGYDGVRCWVCLDYGRVECRRKDSEVAVAAYRWDGGDLIPDPALLRHKHTRRLLRSVYPFTRPRDPADLTSSGKPKPKPGPYSRIRNPTREHGVVPVRVMVRNKLRYLRRITDAELDYMRNHLQDVDWLKGEGGLNEKLVGKLEGLMQRRWREERKEAKRREKEERRKLGWGVRIWGVVKGWIGRGEKGEEKEEEEEIVSRKKRERMEVVKRWEVEVEKRRMMARKERREREEREREARGEREMWAAWERKRMEEEKRRQMVEIEMEMEVQSSWVIA